jgi:ATP-dependent exoDNAse (exonuclease V) beta subunit
MNQALNEPSYFENTVIRASAGTGKTFQLTNRFVALVAADEPVDTILASTFTRKAAGEILDRVLFRLAGATADPDKLEQLAEHVEDSTLDRPRCLELLQRMIRGLHRLRISTLDSFFIQVARSFSLELGLPPGWQIVDPIFDRPLRDQAIGAVLAEESTGDVVRLMHLLTKGEASRSIAAQITALVDDLYAHYLEAPQQAWQALQRPKRLSPQEVQAAIDMLANLELPPDKRFQKAHDRNMDDAANGAWESFISNGLAARIADGARDYYRKPLAEDLLAAYRPLVEHAKAEIITQIANQTEATHDLLQRFDAAYTRLKLARRAFRFEDITRKLARQDAATGVDQIVYRLDAHVAHLLLDEFQDTSPMQWRALAPFARQIAERGGRRSFFCVGDVKQAIYGWRGGVAEIFEALDDELGILVAKSLNESWRSSQPVIDTVNRVFGNLEANAALKDHAEAAKKWAGRFDAHSTARTELAGYCRLAVAPRAAEGEKQGVATLVYAAEQIVELHRRAPGYGIGVLVRRNSAVARLIYELRRRDIEASEEGGNPLTDSAAVQLVLSLLVLADHPGDTTAAFHVATSPLGAELGFTQFDDSIAACRLAQQVRRELMDEGYGPAHGRWIAMLAPHCDRRDLNRLGQLVEMAYAYQPQATTRTDDFVRFVANNKAEDPTAANIRVMTLHQAKGLQFDLVVLPELDVGLTGQTPRIVVGRPGPTQDPQRICRYVNQKLRKLLPRSFGEMFDHHRCREVEEALCVLYVALTRAVHALYMIVAPGTANEKTVPATSAGLLRAALAEDAKAEPNTCLYEHGNPDWFGTAKAAPSAALAEPVTEPSDRPFTVRLAPSPAGSRRELERRSPSSLEGGPRIDLGRRLALDASKALDWGTAIHKCFEQITWIEEDLPDEAVLRQKLDAALSGQLDPGAVIGRFQEALANPAIRAALSRATYQSPNPREQSSAVNARDGLANPRWKVFAERPFAIRDGDAILRGSIDRLVVLYDGRRPVAADVLDFKTDGIDPSDPNAIAAKVDFYRPQLDAYRRAAASLLKLDSAAVSARLLFVSVGVVVSA